MVAQRPLLFDERASPDLRGWFDRLARDSVRIDVAISRIRIAGLDLSDPGLSDPPRIRVCVAGVESGRLEEEVVAAASSPHLRAALARVLSLLESDRLRIRSAPLAGWSPDFSVFHGRGSLRGALIGLHWFQRPFPHGGPALAAYFPGRSARPASVRFGDLWERAHDVRTPVHAVLVRCIRNVG